MCVCCVCKLWHLIRNRKTNFVCNNREHKAIPNELVYNYNYYYYYSKPEVIFSILLYFRYDDDDDYFGGGRCIFASGGHISYDDDTCNIFEEIYTHIWMKIWIFSTFSRRCIVISGCCRLSAPQQQCIVTCCNNNNHININIFTNSNFTFYIILVYCIIIIISS